MEWRGAVTWRFVVWGFIFLGGAVIGVLRGLVVRVVVDLVVGWSIRSRQW